MDISANGNPEQVTNHVLSEQVLLTAYLHSATHDHRRAADSFQNVCVKSVKRKQPQP
jgi:hypothetical protein